jgi:Glycosyltransferase family 87
VSSSTSAIAQGSRRTGYALASVAVVLVSVGSALVLILVRELGAPIVAGSHLDYLAFYAAGRLVLEHDPAGLYLASAITAIERTIIAVPVGANGYMPFINPPFAAVALAPFAGLPPQLARVAWAGLNLVALTGASIWVAWPLAGRQRIAAALLVALSFPAYHALAEGQSSAVLLLGGIAAVQAARVGSWRLAGLALATFWLKPQLIVLPLLALALDRRWTAVAWSLLGGGALVAASLPFVGIGSYATYLGYLVGVGVSHFNGAGAESVWAGALGSLEGLNGLLVGAFGQGSVVVVDVLWAILVAGALGIWLYACRWQRPGFETPAARQMLAAGIGIVLLIDPNLFPQDCLLVFLLVPALGPTTRADYWRVVVALALVAALAALPAHLFTIALLAVVIVWCARPISAARSTP